MDRTLIVWRLLCLLAVMSALMACTPWWSMMPPIWQALSVAAGLLVMVVRVVARCEDCMRSLTRRAASNSTSRGGRDE